MKLIGYAKHLEHEKKLRSILTTSLMKEQIKMIHSVNNLCILLRVYPQESLIILLWISCRSEVTALNQHLDLLHLHTVVLILPVCSREIVRHGHRLYPRFIGYSFENLRDVDVVVSRLIDRNHCFTLH